MNNVTCHKILLRLLADFLNNKKSDIENLSQETWNEIFSLANAHAITPMIFSSIEKLPQELKPSPEVLGKYKESVKISLIKHFLMEQNFERLVSLFDANGVDIILLKGFYIASLYPDPQTRNSGDIDIFVDKKDFEKAGKIIESFSSDVKCVAKEFENIYYISDYLMIELKNKVSVGEGEIFKIFNDEKIVSFGNSHKEKIGSIAVNVPDETYTLLYLVSHMAHHFICGGFGIRHIADFAVFCREKKDSIDFERFYSIINEAKLDKFIAYIAEICKNFLDIDLNLPYETDDFEASDMFIEDIIDAGIFGKTSSERLNSINVTNDLYSKSKTQAGIISYLKALFPSYAHMAMRYPYCKKCRLLLPIAYCSRIISYLKMHSFNSISAVKKTGEMSNKRALLMEKMGFIERDKS